MNNWKVIDSYFQTPYFLTKHHLDSWNDFLVSKINNAVKVLNPFVTLKVENNVEHTIEIYIGGIDGDKLFLNKPTIYENGEQRPMYPNEARLRDMTYQSDLYANILVRYTSVSSERKTTEEREFKDVKIGAIPIMLHSQLCSLSGHGFDILRELGECPYDQGGYFIVDGKEKVIVAQERIALNKLFINETHDDDKYAYQALVRVTADGLFPKTFHIRAWKANAKIDRIEGIYPNSIFLTCPNISKDIPLFILFRALGIESDREILSYILYDVDHEKNKALLDYLRFSIMSGCGSKIKQKKPGKEESMQVYTQHDALEYIRRYVVGKEIDKVKYILVNDFFPNMGTSLRKKAHFLGHIIHRFVKTALGIVQESDRDNYIYKRVDISGFLIGNLFRDYYNQFRNVVRSTVDNQYLNGPWRDTKNITQLINKNNLNQIFRSYIIEDGYRKSLKGAWGKNMIEGMQETGVKEGIVQDLSRISYMGYISHLRRVNTPMDPTSKLVAPHRLHPSQWGIMCPIESPDGGSIGLLKHFSILCTVTFESGVENVTNFLAKLDVPITLVEDIVDLLEVEDSTKVLINSNYYGITDEPERLFPLLKLSKRCGFIDKFTAISWDVISKEINISTEAGRCVRPVYVVNQGKLLIDFNKPIVWDRLIVPEPFEFPKTNILKTLETHQAPIEYLDVEETNNSLIAMDTTEITLRHTHCEIHPSTILSSTSLNIPFITHNQAPRNIFFGAQGKQAIGTPHTSFNHRIDTMAYVLHYPQRQLVTTRYKEYIGNNVLTGGENLIIAIATYTGYNQEDSVIINKAAVERGMFNMTYFKSVIEKEDENQRDNERIIFKNPIKSIEEGLDVTGIKYARYKKTLDDHGFPHRNVYIGEGDAIVGKMLVKGGDEENPTTYKDTSLIADKTISGIIDKFVVYFDRENKKTCKIRLRKTKIPELGDKVASCHAQKGVVGMILPTENMPFNRDGVVPDMIINPHAFPTRMTIGHLLECIVAKECVFKGQISDASAFCETKQEFADLEAFGLERYGNEVLYSGRTGQQINTEIFFGPTYYQRLKHMVSEKMNYRTQGPITMTTRQPTQGRGNNGGLRIGEMERDVLIAQGVSGFLKESLFERSDAYSYKVEDDWRLNTPYCFKLLTQEIVTMGIKPVLNRNTILEEETYDDDSYQCGSDE